LLITALCTAPFGSGVSPTAETALLALTASSTFALVAALSALLVSN
jgi:hypothetical protein